MESSRIPVKSRCNSLDWDSDSGKTGTVKRRPVSTELPGNDSKTGKASDTDSGIHSPLSPGSVYGVFTPGTVCDTSDKLVCRSCKLEKVKVSFFFNHSVCNNPSVFYASVKVIFYPLFPHLKVNYSETFDGFPGVPLYDTKSLLFVDLPCFFLR